MRSLRVIKDPNDELYSMVEKDISQEENKTKVLEDLPLGVRDMPDIKLGVKLPNSDFQWNEADMFLERNCR